MTDIKNVYGDTVGRISGSPYKGLEDAVGGGL
jgi:hypothetical protein